MNPVIFDQANRNLLKPDSMTDEECANLPVYTDGSVCISLWKMTWKERLSALFFGRVWLWVHSGETQPPDALSVERKIFGSHAQ